MYNIPTSLHTLAWAKTHAPGMNEYEFESRSISRKRWPLVRLIFIDWVTIYDYRLYSIHSNTIMQLKKICHLQSSGTHSTINVQHGKHNKIIYTVPTCGHNMSFIWSAQLRSGRVKILCLYAFLCQISPDYMQSVGESIGYAGISWRISINPWQSSDINCVQRELPIPSIISKIYTFSQYKCKCCLNLKDYFLWHTCPEINMERGV